MKESISKFFAKIYNLVPGDLKIIIYPAFFAMVVSYLWLAVEDLKELMLEAGRYELPLVIFCIAAIGGVAGYLNKKAAVKGQAVLVKEGDTKTIEKINTKIVESQELLNSGK